MKLSPYYWVDSINHTISYIKSSAKFWMALVQFPAGQDFSLFHRIQTASGAHPASYQIDTEALSLEVKRLKCEDDHSPPSHSKII
jgi:tetrahydromethanopterin S-methyltransferase subunit H